MASVPFLQEIGRSRYTGLDQVGGFPLPQLPPFDPSVTSNVDRVELSAEGQRLFQQFPPESPLFPNLDIPQDLPLGRARLELSQGGYLLRNLSGAPGNPVQFEATQPTNVETPPAGGDGIPPTGVESTPTGQRQLQPVQDETLDQERRQVAGGRFPAQNATTRIPVDPVAAPGTAGQPGPAIGNPFPGVETNFAAQGLPLPGENRRPLETPQPLFPGPGQFLNPATNPLSVGAPQPGFPAAEEFPRGAFSPPAAPAQPLDEQQREGVQLRITPFGTTDRPETALGLGGTAVTRAQSLGGPQQTENAGAADNFNPRGPVDAPLPPPPGVENPLAPQSIPATGEEGIVRPLEPEIVPLNEPLTENAPPVQNPQREADGPLSGLPSLIARQALALYNQASGMLDSLDSRSPFGLGRIDFYF